MSEEQENKPPSVPAGIHIGKVRDYGITKSQAGNPRIIIGFKIELPDGSNGSVYYNGGLETDKQREFTIKALLACGLNGNLSTVDELVAFNQGAGSGALNEDKDVEVVVEHEEYEGKTFARVKFVNEPGGSTIKNKLAKDDLVATMKGFNLGGDIMKMRKENPNASQVKNHAPGSSEPTMNLKEDLPF